MIGNTKHALLAKLSIKVSLHHTRSLLALIKPMLQISRFYADALKNVQEANPSVVNIFPNVRKNPKILFHFSLTGLRVGSITSKRNVGISRVCPTSAKVWRMGMHEGKDYLDYNI